jgi:outer membrane murein-binding lipoprotein Lpp
MLAAMRWMVVLCVVVSACASDAEMRPRGRRNSVRIDELDARISSLEGKPTTVKSGALSQHVAELEAELKQLKHTIELLQSQVHAAEPVPVVPPAAPAAPAAP